MSGSCFLARSLALPLLCHASGLVHALVTVALDLAFELVDEQIDRGLVCRRGLACDEVGALREDDPFCDVVVPYRRVTLARERHFDDGALVEPPTELREPLLGIGVHCFRDASVLCLDLELHRGAPFGIVAMDPLSI